MPEHSDKYKPSEADLDLVLEEAGGKPIRSTNLAAGIASIRRRITDLEADKVRILAELDCATEELEMALNKELGAIKKHLITARERLSHYESQLDMRN